MFKYLVFVFVCVVILWYFINKGRIYESKCYEGKKCGRKKGNVVVIFLYKLVLGVEKVSWMLGLVINLKVLIGLLFFFFVWLYNGEIFLNYEYYF